MNKGLPLTLTGNKMADLAGKSPAAGRVGYYSDGDNHFLIGNGTSAPYEYPTVSKTIKLINDAIANSGGGGTSTGVLVTAPIVTGSSTVAANTNVTLTASGSHSALEDDTRVTVKYVWTKPDNSTAEGATLSVTSSATAGGVLTIKCKAVDTLNNASNTTTFTLTSTAAVNNLPSTPSIVTDFPATVVRGSSYTLKFASTDVDGDTIIFAITSISGASASAMSGITASAGVSITVEPQADTVTLSVKAVDSKGGQSTNALTLTRTGNTVTNPTGTTGFLTPGQTHVISVPDWADTATFTGNGGAGTAACANGQYHIGANRRAWSLAPTGGSLNFYTAAGGLLSSPDPDYPESTTNANGCWRLRAAYNSTFTTSYGDTVGTGQLASSNFSVMGTSTPNTANTDASAGNPSNSYVTPQPIIHSTLGTLYPSALQYVGAASTNAAGADTTVSGAVTATFSGAASGVTTAPAQYSQIKTLLTGTNRTLTVTIPASGSCKVDWS